MVLSLKKKKLKVSQKLDFNNITFHRLMFSYPSSIGNEVYLALEKSVNAFHCKDGPYVRLLTDNF